jgi:peptidoglycan/LPS O-acetylase OafA/YrhL
MSKSSVAIENLRGFVVVMVVAFHASMAYLQSQPASEPLFDSPPYAWMATPIVDSARWLPLDLFSAFQFLHLMQLLFFLSGIFVWPSLRRKGPTAFLRNRTLRLGIPFLLGTYLLMPAAYYAVYRVTATDPSVPAFWRHWLALPFWPNGPMWFLWFLLMLDTVATALFCFAPQPIESMGRLAAKRNLHPGRFFIALIGISALAYVPLARVFTPWAWTEFGPFAFQVSFAPQYVIYFFAGLIVGIDGLERGLFDPDGMLARRALQWIAAALAVFIVWLLAMAVVVKGLFPGVPGRQIAADLATVLFVACACFGSVAGFLRYANARRPAFRNLAENGYGIYVFHYVFVLWTQYFLLSVAAFALVKALVVFGVTLVLSWTASAALCRVPVGAHLLRGATRLPTAAALPVAAPATMAVSRAGSSGSDLPRQAHP